MERQRSLQDKSVKKENPQEVRFGQSDNFFDGYFKDKTKFFDPLNNHSNKVDKVSQDDKKK